MDKFTKWLKNKGFEGVTLEAVRFGSDYFYNAPAVSFSAVLVSISWSSGYGHAARTEKRIRDYVKRYGYKVYTSGCNMGGLWFTVCRPADAAALDLYSIYQDRSVKQYEIVAHNYYTGRIDLNGRSLNDTARAIMDKWEARYIKALKEVKTA